MTVSAHDGRELAGNERRSDATVVAVDEDALHGAAIARKDALQRPLVNETREAFSGAPSMVASSTSPIPRM